MLQYVMQATGSDHLMKVAAVDILSVGTVPLIIIKECLNASFGKITITHHGSARREV